MNIEELLYAINQLLPIDSALKGDKVGLQIQSNNYNYKKLLITMEITEEVIEEAVHNSCPCIVTFHPLIFTPLSEISQEERVGSLSYKLIKNDISIVSVHTTYDTSPFGNNKYLADLFELRNLNILKSNGDSTQYGMGIIGELPIAYSNDEFVKLCSEKFQSPIRSNAGIKSDKINKVAIVGGSGSSYLPDVIKSDADAFITADLTYHIFHSVGEKLLLIDPGHYEMEQFISKNLADNMKNSKYFSEIEIIRSRVYTNPIMYYPNKKFNEMQKNLIN